jgi:hypothetical protein
MKPASIDRDLPDVSQGHALDLEAEKLYFSQSDTNGDGHLGKKEFYEAIMKDRYTAPSLIHTYHHVKDETTIRPMNS